MPAVCKLKQARLEQLEVVGVEAGVDRWRRRWWGMEGLEAVLRAVAERLGQNADAGLVEVRLVMPASEFCGVVVGGEEEGVGGGAEGKVGCAVGVLEVELMRGRDGAVVAGLRRSAGEAAGVAVEFARRSWRSCSVQGPGESGMKRMR